MQSNHYGPYLNQVLLTPNPIFTSRIQSIDDTFSKIDAGMTLIDTQFGDVRSKVKIILQTIPDKLPNLGLCPEEFDKSVLFNFFQEHFKRFEDILFTHELISKNGYSKLFNEQWQISFWGQYGAGRNSILTITDNENKIKYMITLYRGFEQDSSGFPVFKDGYVQLVKSKFMPNLYPGNPNEQSMVVYNFNLKGKGCCRAGVNSEFKNIKISPELIQKINHLIDVTYKTVVLAALDKKLV